jgi:hypothetical protein
MRPRLTALFLVALLLASCAGSTTSDPTFGPEILALQQKVDRFLATFENAAGTSDGDYAAHALFYVELQKNVTALRNRAASVPGNAAAVADLDGISENLVHLESLHRQGVTPAEVPVLRKLLGTQFNALYQSVTGQTSPAGKE